jgi:alkylation response protein AidB-like acyl-CoA dehydrogenase
VTCHVLDRPGFEALLAEQPRIAEHLADMLATREAASAAQRETLSAAARQRGEADQRSRVLAKLRNLLGPT